MSDATTTDHYGDHAVVDDGLKKEFAAFVDPAAVDRPMFMFFTSGLLHVVETCLRWVPEHVDLRLITAGLDGDELAWLDANVGRPRFSIPYYVDDKVIWDLLFDYCRTDFGWLDADCFVLEPGIFEMLREPMAGDVLCRTTFLYEPLEMAGTPLVFFSRAAIDELLAQVDVTPSTYAHHATKVGRFGGPGWTRKLTPQLVQVVSEVLECNPPAWPVRPQGGLWDIYTDGLVWPMDDRGKPQPPGVERAFLLFDTLLVLQMAGHACGLRPEAIDDEAIGRAFDGRTSSCLSWGGGVGTPRTTSTWVKHCGGVSYYGRGMELGGEWVEESLRRFQATAALDLLALEAFCARPGAPALYFEKLDRTRRDYAVWQRDPEVVAEMEELVVGPRRGAAV